MIFLRFDLQTCFLERGEFCLLFQLALDFSLPPFFFAFTASLRRTSSTRISTPIGHDRRLKVCSEHYNPSLKARDVIPDFLAVKSFSSHWGALVRRLARA